MVRAMPASDTHQQYDAVLPQWLRILHLLEGADRVKDEGRTYLPQITGTDDDQYDAYKQRAVLFNATGRTHEAMVGFLFRKPPTVVLDGLDEFVENADNAGTTFAGYCRKVTVGAASLGRCGTLIDWAPDDETGGRAYLTFFAATDIINWRTEVIAGKTVLTMIVLREPHLEPGADNFTMKAMTQYRAIFLRNGEVVHEIWRAQSANETRRGREVAPKTTEPKLAETLNITRRGEPLDAIPFIFHNCDAPGPAVSKPPLSDISAVNISQYQTSADLENGRHVAGCPTPFAVGFDVGDSKLYFGTSHVWVSENPGANAGFIEFTGQGLTPLKEAIIEKQEQMAALGARLIEPPRKDSEAFDTVMLRASAETSTLGRLGLLTSEGLSEVLTWVEWWHGSAPTRLELADKAYMALNKDFVSSALTPEQLNAYRTTWQASGMSWDVYFHNLERGEMYPEGWTIEDEKAAIDANPPMPPISGMMLDGTPIVGNTPPDLPKPPDPNKPPPAKKGAAK